MRLLWHRVATRLLLLWIENCLSEGVTQVTRLLQQTILELLVFLFSHFKALKMFNRTARLVKYYSSVQVFSEIRVAPVVFKNLLYL